MWWLTSSPGPVRPSEVRRERGARAQGEERCLREHAWRQRCARHNGGRWHNGERAVCGCGTGNSSTGLAATVAPLEWYLSQAGENNNRKKLYSVARIGRNNRRLAATYGLVWG